MIDSLNTRRELSSSRPTTAVRVGAHVLGNPVILAPMTGITDAPFRRMVARLGAGLVVSEMTASALLVAGRPNAVLRAEGQGVGLHVVQLAGCDPRWMAEGARVAEASGADIIDINMGCPARNVAGKQAGSALMRDLDHALSLIDATVAATTRPVTLKMRLGWDDASINAPELARRAEAAGIRMVTVHGRTRCQFYKGSADWRAIRAVRDAIRVPLVVNGDIADAQGARTALALSGADAVMIGRAAQGRPWLPGQIARQLDGGAEEGDPPLPRQYAIIEQLYDEMLSHHGTRIGRNHARKHLGWAIDTAVQTADLAPGIAKDWRCHVLTADEPRDVSARLAAMFETLGERAAA